VWFFNFVQTPAYAEMDAATRNNALDKLTWRALWWFRWAAAATVFFGVLLLEWVASKKRTARQQGLLGALGPGPTLLLGIIMGIIMSSTCGS
jgi:hypothetical protein